MGTPGSGRKRTPIKDRFSAEDETLSHIAREAEARLAAKRAARAEARDIRMRELERQQKELSHRSHDRKWGQIQKWMEDSERAKYSHRSSHHSHVQGPNNMKSARSNSSHRSSSLNVNGSHRSRESTSRRRDILPDFTRDKSSKSNRASVTSGFYHDKRNYNDINYSRPTSTYHTRSSSLYSDPLATSKNYRASNASTGLTRSTSLASLYDGDVHNSYSSSIPTKYSYSSRASSVRSSPVCTDDESESIVSPNRAGRGRSDSVSSDFSDPPGSTADYFSRSNRRGSIISDVDDVSIPDLNSLDDKIDKQYTDVYTRPSSRNAVSGLPGTPLSGGSSRRGSGDTNSLLDPDASLSELRDIYDLKDQIQDVEGRYMQGLKELKDSLSEVEEKYKKAMVSNAQLDNEKSNLIYQVDTLKDVVEEMEEQMAEYYRENEEKTKELERQKHTCTVLQHKLDELKEGIRQRDELIEENRRMQQKIDSQTREVFDLQETINWKEKKIGALERQKEYFDCIRIERDELKDELTDLREKMKTGEKHGLVIIPDGTPNGDIDHESRFGAITLVSQEAAQVLESAGEGPLDVRLRKLAEEKDELISQIRKLKLQLDEERQKNSQHENTITDASGLENGSDLQLIEMQRDANRQISEFKFKLSKAEQDMTTMEQNTVRLEGQVLRYKAAAENAEKVEDELKAEKRKLQRELRTALDKMEEMEMTNSHLVKRLEKMKANRTALLSQQ
uniref:Leucine-rich repeat flightless-interacting protein 2 n=1 Tax=Geotrypetes seraphini TaxID=260995 RepID=A0A6P8QGC3_GEOSA|nr:leucine-rich repeat flightless-interacting protein 2 isoform X1 [Geotrypetes seraphini]XP_033786425.1 leucine-rich repeat flightless-interacting protein 2 isoform X1 [Geotrypetes seraphini]XP_033786426.1 leucine-rich repeat flightless-interacting protein 2 isoform X1 [Geotrypetes seraphini]XP_033786427.1 leucine-rich repeat flightless-interacting protein 2 isoform X1 [Geotrypetes seraphini]XP_033786428.1 leucine-rich repeat flightless-interacting protein 2 isoform X1 [Geotrypetes seraphini]